MEYRNTTEIHALRVRRVRDSYILTDPCSAPSSGASAKRLCPRYLPIRPHQTAYASLEMANRILSFEMLTDPHMSGVTNKQRDGRRRPTPRAGYPAGPQSDLRARGPGGGWP